MQFLCTVTRFETFFGGQGAWPLFSWERDCIGVRSVGDGGHNNKTCTVIDPSVHARAKFHLRQLSSFGGTRVEAEQQQQQQEQQQDDHDDDDEFVNWTFQFF